jgi:hypothetical protein
MGFKKGNPGRPVGAVNRLNAEVKDVLVRAYHDLGGFKAFMKWLREDQEHLDHFYQHMYMKLLPMQVNVDKTENVVYKSFLQAVRVPSVSRLASMDSSAKGGVTTFVVDPDRSTRAPQTPTQVQNGRIRANFWAAAFRSGSISLCSRPDTIRAAKARARPFGFDFPATSLGPSFW